MALKSQKDKETREPSLCLSLTKFETTYANIYFDLSPYFSFGETQSIIWSDSLANEYCTVFKCVHCGELFYPPELQDIYILSNEVYATVVALQRAYVENLVEGNIVKADATMRVIENLRREYGVYDSTSLYDFRNHAGDYIGCYKFMYEAYSGFNIEITTTDKTDQIIDFIIIDTMSTIPGGIGIFYSVASYILRIAEYQQARTFSDAINTTVFNELVTDALIEFSLYAIVKDVNCKNFEYSIECLKMAWGMNNIITEKNDIYRNNYAISIEYSVPEELSSESNQGLVVHCEYSFNDRSNIKILQEGFKTIDTYCGPDVSGKFKCNISNAYYDWTELSIN